MLRVLRRDLVLVAVLEDDDVHGVIVLLTSYCVCVSII